MGVFFTRSQSDERIVRVNDREMVQGECDILVTTKTSCHLPFPIAPNITLLYVLYHIPCVLEFGGDKGAMAGYRMRKRKCIGG